MIQRESKKATFLKSSIDTKELSREWQTAGSVHVDDQLSWMT